MNPRFFRHITVAAALCAATAVHAVPISGTNGTLVGIPDNNTTGVTSTISIADMGLINSMNVVVAINHTWLGDLIVSLTRGATTIRLMNRPGSGTFGDSSNLSASYPITFSAQAGISAETMGAVCDTNGVVGFSTGCSNSVFTPEDSFASFLGTDVGGDWVLRVSDNAVADVGSLSSWTANFDVTQSVPEPASLALVGLALLGAVAARRRKL